MIYVLRYELQFLCLVSRIMEGRPLWNVFKNNCQVFAKCFLEQLIPDFVCPETFPNFANRSFRGRTHVNVAALIRGSSSVTAHSSDSTESGPRNERSWFPSKQMSLREEVQGRPSALPDSSQIPISVIREFYDIHWQNPIGQGSYGKVIEAVHRTTGEVHSLLHSLTAEMCHQSRKRHNRC
jgi:hypothetical protein